MQPHALDALGSSMIAKKSVQHNNQKKQKKKSQSHHQMRMSCLFSVSF